METELTSTLFLEACHGCIQSSNFYTAFLQNPLKVTIRRDKWLLGHKETEAKRQCSSGNAYHMPLIHLIIRYVNMCHQLGFVFAHRAAAQCVPTCVSEFTSPVTAIQVKTLCSLSYSCGLVGSGWLSRRHYWLLYQGSPCFLEQPNKGLSVEVLVYQKCHHV